MKSTDELVKELNDINEEMGEAPLLMIDGNGISIGRKIEDHAKMIAKHYELMERDLYYRDLEAEVRRIDAELEKAVLEMEKYVKTKL